MWVYTGIYGIYIYVSDPIPQIYNFTQFILPILWTKIGKFFGVNVGHFWQTFCSWVREWTRKCDIEGYKVRKTDWKRQTYIESVGWEHHSWSDTREKICSNIFKNMLKYIQYSIDNEYSRVLLQFIQNCVR